MSFHPAPPPTARVRQALVNAGGQAGLPALVKQFEGELQLMTVHNTLASMSARREVFRDSETGLWVLVDEQELTE